MDYEIEYDSDLFFGLFGRVYFFIVEDKVFFLQGNFGFGSFQDCICVGDDFQIISMDVLVVSFGLGFIIYSLDGIGIEVIVKYNWV